MSDTHNHAPIEGGCFCGALRYRLAEKPSASMVCHCNTCRRLFAAPVVAWLTVASEHFAFTQGSPSEFSTSPPAKRWFCQTCGTHVAYTREDWPGQVEVATCSLDDAAAFAPTHHSWLDHDLDWVIFGDGLPTFQGSRHGAAGAVPATRPAAAHYPKDIYTEPEPDPHTLANLGPLTGMAGIWSGARGLDVNPKADGPEKQAYIEHMELQPIDAQTNGPQLFYGLRYHTRIVKPNDVETFHDQVGYWLWEPATGTVILTLSIPRGQAAMAVGKAAPDAKSFTLQAVRGATTNGIVSNPFLEHAFRTDNYSIKVTINNDGTWSYEQETTLVIPGQAEPFRHTDRNTLRKLGEPTPNPTAQAAAGSTGG